MSTDGARSRIYAALDSYELRRDPEDHRVEPALPADPGPVHAVSKYKRTSRQPDFLSAWQYDRALCGATAKVLLPVEFDPQDPDACPRCAAHAADHTQVPRRPEPKHGAVVKSDTVDGRTVHWFACAACGAVGADHGNFGEAQRDAQTHNYG